MYLRRQKMLILTRRVSECLMIGDNVSVTILGVKGKQVRIGIDAPKEVAVHRKEIYDRISAEKNESKSLSAKSDYPAKRKIDEPEKFTVD